MSLSAPCTTLSRIAGIGAQGVEALLEQPRDELTGCT
jgi:hypothetical protein